MTIPVGTRSPDGGQATKYIIITDGDANIIAQALAVYVAGYMDPEAQRVRLRLEADTGADIQDIVDQLNGTETCAACNIEGQASYCIVWRTHRLGRRLRRLLERARGERAPGDVNATD